LNIPVLAFVHDDRYWLVMAASAHLRGLAISGSVDDLQPMGAAKYYDVKPLWAKSHARPIFMQKLAELGINPSAPAASAEMRAQWAALQATVIGDIDFVSQEGSLCLPGGLNIPGSCVNAPLIDYSLLFELYAPGRRVDIRGKHCLETPSCFEEDPAACHVLCVSVIDFFTKFTFKRWLESWWRRFKFHDYAQKTKDLLECPFSQRFPSPEASFANGGSMTMRPLDSISGDVRVVAKVRWVAGSSYKESTCKPYLDMACENAVSDTTLLRGDCRVINPRYCSEAICTFQVKARYLDQCGSWMQEWCQHELDEFNHRQLLS